MNKKSKIYISFLTAMMCVFTGCGDRNIDINTETGIALEELFDKAVMLQGIVHYSEEGEREEIPGEVTLIEGLSAILGDRIDDYSYTGCEDFDKDTHAASENLKGEWVIGLGEDTYTIYYWAYGEYDVRCSNGEIYRLVDSSNTSFTWSEGFIKDDGCGSIDCDMCNGTGESDSVTEGCSCGCGG